MKFFGTRQPTGTFDEQMDAIVASKIEQIEQAGKWDEGTADVLAEVLLEATRESALAVVDSWIRDGKKHQRRMARYMRGFEKQLRKDYGAGLDRMQAFIAVTADVGNSYTSSERAERRDPHYFHALSGLHARGCRIANEVHCLLERGYPMAALARTRTLHEVSVVATLLAEHEETHADLAERYVLHETLLNLSDARVYQQRAEGMGYEQFEQDFMDTLAREAVDLIERFGPEYKKPFG